MKLTAKVIGAHAASEFTDNHPRVTVKVAEADHMDNKLKLRNTDSYALDDELVVLVLTKEQAAGISADLAIVPHLPVYGHLTVLADQLHPDPPVPFLSDPSPHAHLCTAECYESPDTADTQEFRLGGTV